jgi:diguanylate cyclase (GGDEF)-like protein
MLFGMYGSVPDAISIDIGNVILFASFAVTWSGARVFDGRAPEPLYLVGGAAIWLMACRSPYLANIPEAKVLLSSALITSYIWATAYEFWRGRSEPLVSRWPAIFLLFAHGALFLLRTPLSQVLPWTPDHQVFESVWMTVLSFEALLFTIAIAFILLAMAKERTELRHKTAALIDPLTGIANRRAFLEETMALGEGRRAVTSCTVVLADLDHFKSINDRFGHAVGDRVLQLFASDASAKLGPFDLIGRLGGEEFAIVLHDTGRDKGYAVAERIRMAFEAATIDVDGLRIGATVSMGMVVAEDGLFDMPGLLDQADTALYGAKELGRNRVEIATYKRPSDRPHTGEKSHQPVTATASGAA